MERITAESPLSQSADIVENNLEKLKQLFPSVFTEDKIDFEALRDLLGDQVETDPEYYRFTWPGKTMAKAEARKPSRGTLRPAPEESVDWNNTENLYIEGDNLEVLKLLQKSYAGKIKMIYIDPPYNTGKDFVYKDNYKDNLASYKERFDRVDAEGNLKSSASQTNQEGGAHYHSNWLNMMYPRLTLARNLLTEDGVIFISIDDNEVENLKKIGYEIFGETNFIGQWNWFKSGTPPNLSTKIKKNIEYILCFEKIKNEIKYTGLKKESKSDDPLTKSQNIEKKLTFKPGELQINLEDQIIKKGIYGTETYPNELLIDLEIVNGTNKNEVSFWNRFIWTQQNLESELEKNTLVKINSKSLVLSYKKSEYNAEVPPNLIDAKVNVSTTENAGRYLQGLMGGKKVFSYPKPVDLMSYLQKYIDLEDEYVLDFFSGSGSTAEAVLSSRKSKFIMVQLDQKIDPSQINDPSEKQIAKNAIELLDSFQAPHNLCELGKERIRRAGKKILEENPELKGKLDIGFKVFKLDESNIKTWETDPEKLDYNLLTEDVIKEDRTDLDVLYEILLKYGLDLTLPIQEKTLGEQKIYSIGGGALFVCLSNNITPTTAQELIDWAQEFEIENPQVVFKDNGFENSQDKVNTLSLLKSNGIKDVWSI